MVILIPFKLMIGIMDRNLIEIVILIILSPGTASCAIGYKLLQITNYYYFSQDLQGKLGKIQAMASAAVSQGTNSMATKSLLGRKEFFNSALSSMLPRFRTIGQMDTFKTA